MRNRFGKKNSDSTTKTASSATSEARDDDHEVPWLKTLLDPTAAFLMEAAPTAMNKKTPPTDSKDIHIVSPSPTQFSGTPGSVNSINQNHNLTKSPARFLRRTFQGLRSQNQQQQQQNPPNKESSSRSHKSVVIKENSKNNGIVETDSESRSSSRLGIRDSPFDVVSISNDDETASAAPISIGSNRLGIQRPNYDIPKEVENIPHLTNVSTNLLGARKAEENEIIFEGDQRVALTPPFFESAWSSNKKEQAGQSCDGSSAASSNLLGLHEPTARGHYLVNKDINFDPNQPVEGLRYNISHGRDGMTSDMKRKSRDSLKKIQLLWAKNRSGSDNGNSNGKTNSEALLPVPQPLPASVKNSDDDTLIKIFLLLLQPNSKIFELIQVYYPPSTTTVGDIIDMIPKNATEPALGNQKYTGLMRPRRRAKGISNMDLLASNPKLRKTAGIEHGEILVAIPYGFTNRHIVNLSKQILSNPRIKKLMKNSNPLGLQKQQNSTSSRRRCVELRSVQEDAAVEDTPDNRSLVPLESSNSGRGTALLEISAVTSEEDHYNHQSYHSKNQLSCNGDLAEMTPGALDAYLEETKFQPISGGFEEDGSLEGSLMSWSQSVDNSLITRSQFASTESISSAKSSKTTRWKKRKARYLANVGNALVLIVAYMLFRYYTDPNGHAAHRSIELVEQKPIGVSGFLWLACVLYMLIKIQKFVTSDKSVDEMKCPVIQTIVKGIGRLEQKRKTRKSH